MSFSQLPQEQQSQLIDLAKKIPVNQPNEFCRQASQLGIVTNWQIFTDAYEMVAMTT